MKEKIYYLIISEPYENVVYGILSFHNLENAIARGKEFIKEWYKEEGDKNYSLDNYYEDWEETRTFAGIYSIEESEFED